MRLWVVEACGDTIILLLRGDVEAYRIYRSLEQVYRVDGCQSVHLHGPWRRRAASRAEELAREIAENLLHKPITRNK